MGIILSESQISEVFEWDPSWGQMIQSSMWLLLVAVDGQPRVSFGLVACSTSIYLPFLTTYHSPPFFLTPWEQWIQVNAFHNSLTDCKSHRQCRRESGFTGVFWESESALFLQAQKPALCGNSSFKAYSIAHTYFLHWRTFCISGIYSVCICFVHTSKGTMPYFVALARSERAGRSALSSCAGVGGVFLLSTPLPSHSFLLGY